MKKFVSVILTLAMLVTMFVFTVPASTAAVEPAALTLLGDVNSDSKISAKDSLSLRMYVAGDTGTVINADNADVNSDSKINSGDIIILRSYLAGAISAFGQTSENSIGSLNIGGNSINNYEIIIPEGINFTEESDRDISCFCYAARQLRNYIAASGKTLDITYLPTSTRKQIHLIIDDATYGEEGYNIKTENGNVYITAGHRRGTLYGVWEFLESYLGFRFLGQGYEYLYDNAYINIPNGIDRTEFPSFVYRDSHGKTYNGDGSSFDIANTATQRRINSHTDRGAICSPKFGYGYGNVWINAHSFEYMGVVDAGGNTVTGSTQPCLSNGTNLSIAYNFWMNILHERNGEWGQAIGYELTRVSSSWGDNMNFCQCAACRSVYTAEGSISGSILRFNNSLVSMINNTFPTMQVYFIAYGDARSAPTVTKAHTNIVVCFCWAGCNNHLMTETCPGNTRYPGGEVLRNQTECGYVEDWTEVADHVMMWYYIGNFVVYGLQPPVMMNFREDCAYLASIGVEGIYAENSADCADTGLEFLTNYMLAQTMWDANMTEQEFNDILNEALYIHYGNGWELVRQIIDMYDTAGDRACHSTNASIADGCWTDNFDWPQDMFSYSYIAENFETMCTLLSKAYTLVEHEGQTTNLNRLLVPIYFLGLSATYSSNYANGSSAQRATFTSRYQTLHSMIQEYDVTITQYFSRPSTIDYSKTPEQLYADLWPNDYSGSRTDAEHHR